VTEKVPHGSTGRRWRRANSMAALIYAPAGNCWDKLPRLRSNHAPRQRFTLLMRNVLARVPKRAQAMVAATVRTIFEQSDRTTAAAQLRRVCETLASRFPAVVQLLEEAEGEILTFYDFPAEHRRQIYSTNPLERLNKELKRRSAVVGIFPNRTAVLRLFCALLAEQNDEWLVGRHYFSETSMRKVLHPLEEEVTEVPAA
jgi:putative transposase